jgi:disulfide bond formation protein DsbB
MADRQFLMVLAASGSAALLGGAYVFQFFGYPPCAMCLWQRWPHGAAIIIGLLALMFPARILAALGALAAATTAGIGLYHTGVEKDWWEGPTSCTGSGGLDGLALDQLLPSSDGPALVLCDQVSWQFLTLSMATWNAAFSFLLVLIWLRAALTK